MRACGTSGRVQECGPVCMDVDRRMTKTEKDTSCENDGLGCES